MALKVFKVKKKVTDGVRSQSNLALVRQCIAPVSHVLISFLHIIAPNQDKDQGSLLNSKIDTVICFLFFWTQNLRRFIIQKRVITKNIHFPEKKHI